jgi:2-keto-4-pentenoate hydratase/2-oxohepta-3-ene-1,7-dioic acid hydratase in catechol pathway
VRLVAHFDDLDLPVSGVLVGDHVLTLDLLVEEAGLREELAFLDPRGLLAEDDDLAETRAALERALGSGVAGVLATSLRPAPPLEPGKIICVGQNYASHVLEQGLPLPTRPMLFAKFANAVVGDGDPVIQPATTHALDLEAELAVVIGRRAHRVTAAAALAHVAGYRRSSRASVATASGCGPRARTRSYRWDPAW